MTTLAWIAVGVIGWVAAIVLILRFNYNASRISNGTDEDRLREEGY